MLKRLREMRDSANVSNKEISDATGIPESTVNKIFTGVTKEPTLSKISAIVHYLGYTLDDLSERSNNTFSTKEYEHIKKYRSLDEYGKKAVDGLLNTEYDRCTYLAAEQEIIHLPKSVLKASAGSGNWLDEQQLESVSVLDTPQSRKANLVIEVDGDSMSPMYENGDNVLVNTKSDVAVGDIGIFIVDGNGYIKKLGKDRLISVNPEYDDIFPTEYSDFRCVGKVLGEAEIVE